MSVMNTFLKNTLLASTMAFGGLSDTQAQENTQHDPRDKPYVGYLGLYRVNSHMLGLGNPFEDGMVLQFGGEVPMTDNKHSPFRFTGLMGEYRYHFRDPNTITHQWHFQQRGAGNQSGAGFYQRIPSRAVVAAYAKTPEKYPGQAMIYGGLLAYPGAEINMANWAHFVVGGEVRFDLFPKRSNANIKFFAGVEHIMYNDNWTTMNQWRPDAATSTTFKFGARLTRSYRAD